MEDRYIWGKNSHSKHIIQAKRIEKSGESLGVHYEAFVENHPVTVPLGMGKGEDTRLFWEDVTKGKSEDVILWNYADNGHDFCYALWKLFDSRYTKGHNKNPEMKALLHEKYAFDAYEEVRNLEPEPQFLRVFHKLESLRYLRAYTLCTQERSPAWTDAAKSDGTIDVALLSKKFTGNALLREQMRLLLELDAAEADVKKYFLTDTNRHQYLSSVPGQFGGHLELKIYGRMDCPSANRYIQKGQYVQHRVFFSDEETARRAGFHPCGVCMREEHKIWKAEKNRADKNE